MEIMFQPYNREFKREVETLFEESVEGESLRNIFKSTMSTVSYVALIEEKVIGLLLAWENPFHPEATYFKILTEAEYATERIKKTFFHKIREEADRGQAFITSVIETAISSRDFYEKNGFKEIRRTFMPSLVVEEILDSLVAKELKEGKIKSLAEVLEEEYSFSQLADLVKNNYEASHYVNPVKEMSVEEWKELITAEDILKEGSFILFNDEGEVIAYSFLHRSENEDTLELGWCGGSSFDRAGALPYLVGKQINYARERDVQYILGEFDTTDPFGMEVMRTFTFRPFPAWISYKG